jgi:hypothetical protein
MAWSRALKPTATAHRTMEPGTVAGIHLFNTRKFFEAHEAPEAVWLKAKGDS